MSVSASLSAGALLDGLRRRGIETCEVYKKRGRSRRIQAGADGRSAAFAEESGWAIRAGSKKGSWLLAGTGDPTLRAAWPAPAGLPLALPEPSAAPEPFTEPRDLDSPLLGEDEGYGLIEGVAEELGRELPGARLLRAIVEDGSSESELVSSTGVVGQVRQRVASVRLWGGVAEVSNRGALGADFVQVAREARGLSPNLLARRLADRLVVLQRGRPPVRRRGSVVLAPEVVGHLLAGLLPAFADPRQFERLAMLAGRSGELGGPALTIVDDGRLPGAPLQAPVDGEGVPTRRVVLIAGGSLRQPLLPWWEDAERGTRSGCRPRPSWREPPRTGASHFYLEPDPGVSVATLLALLERGYYFIAGEPRVFDLAGDRFELEVLGFSIRRGEPARPVRDARLLGTIRALLRGVVAVARDLSFFPVAGCMGSPSVLIDGLEVRPG